MNYCMALINSLKKAFFSWTDLATEQKIFLKLSAISFGSVTVSPYFVLIIFWRF